MIKFQISNPQILNVFDSNDITISDAIESIFPLDTEFAFLIWNHVYIPLSYKYDISIMFSDLVDVYNFIEDNKKVSFEIHWASNTFASIWNIRKEDDFIAIDSTWRDTLGYLTDILNRHNKIKMNALDFQKEINKMIDFVKHSLQNSGYKLSNLE